MGRPRKDARSPERAGLRCAGRALGPSFRRYPRGSSRRPPARAARQAAVDLVTSADDLAVSKMRPYAIADAWDADRRATLDLFLHATRSGMLGLSWEVLCPHCRGSRHGKSDLAQVSAEAEPKAKWTAIATATSGLPHSRSQRTRPRPCPPTTRSNSIMAQARGQRPV